MKVKALQEFKDLQVNCFRREGESFEVTKERADELSATPYGSLIEILEEDPKEKAKQEADSKEKEPEQVVEPGQIVEPEQVVEPGQIVESGQVVEPAEPVAPVKQKSKKAKA